LDTRTELALLKNIEKILKEKQRTSVFIAHRLKTISNSGLFLMGEYLLMVDKIIVLDQGRVAESGSHAELLGHDGHYSKLWREQRAAEGSE
jgi:ATP-binding cassette, subfamily B (MDR/TAP), member 7